jgi:outer membrane biosynthesis protein TonB
MAWLRLAAMAVLFALAACSNTPIGEQLGNSFGPTPATTKTTTQPVAVAPKPVIKPVEPKPEPPKPEISKPVPQAVEPIQQKPEPAEQQKPVPYRVLLRLPATDPAAPAEALTRALRAANLPFEVETIERVRQGDGR